MKGYTVIPLNFFINNFWKLPKFSGFSSTFTQYLADISSKNCTHKNSLVSEESYRKVFDLTKAVFDMGTSLGSNPKLKKKIVCQKFSIEWCSHKTFDKKKILQRYRQKNYGQSVDKFWVIFNNLRERQIEFGKFFSEKKNWLQIALNP